MRVFSVSDPLPHNTTLHRPNEASLGLRYQRFWRQIAGACCRFSMSSRLCLFFGLAWYNLSNAPVQLRPVARPGSMSIDR
jgi:hypothetical protein